MSILTAPVFIISGSSKVGKTSIAAELAKELNCSLVSFGDYVRSRASLLLGDVTPSRQFLQDLGQELVRQDPEAFCRDVLSSSVSSQEQPLVIDGLRHIVLLRPLATLLGGREVRLIFVEATPEARMTRWGAEITRLELNAIDSHPVEADLAQIRERADLVVETQARFEEAFRTVMRWIARTYPRLATLKSKAPVVEPHDLPTKI